MLATEVVTKERGNGFNITAATNCEQPSLFQGWNIAPLLMGSTLELCPRMQRNRPWNLRFRTRCCSALALLSKHKFAREADLFRLSFLSIRTHSFVLPTWNGEANENFRPRTYLRYILSYYPLKREEISLEISKNKKKKKVISLWKCSATQKRLEIYALRVTALLITLIGNKTPSPAPFSF